MKGNAISRNDRKAAVLRWLPAVMAAVCLLVLGFRQVQRWSAARGAMVIAVDSLAKGTVLEPQHLRLVPVRGRTAPAGLLRSTAQARGRTLTIAKKAGEPILASELLTPVAVDNHLSTMIPPGRVLTSLTLKNIVVPVQDLRRGDRIDILAAGVTEDRRRVSRIIARDAFVIGYARATGGGDPRAADADAKAKKILGVDVSPPSVRTARDDSQALIIALKPGDVIPLADVDGSDAHISIVVHSRDDVKNGTSLSIVPPTALKTVEVILGSSRERVPIP